MANIDIKIENINEIRAAFRKAPLVMTQNLDRAIKRSLLSIQAISMRNTPVRTGRLRASHTTRFTPLMGVLQPTAHYAIYVHDGTRFMKARPFLANAVKTQNAEVQDNFKKAVRDTLDTIARESR